MTGKAKDIPNLKHKEQNPVFCNTNAVEKGVYNNFIAMPLPEFLTNTPLHPSFDRDIRDTHLIYDYDAQDANGNPEKWRYEM